MAAAAVERPVAAVRVSDAYASATGRAVGALALRPRRPWLGPLALDGAAATLYAEIAAAPGRLPAPGTGRATLRRLILDCAVEILAGGEYVSGAGAWAWLSPEPSPAAPPGRLARLSRDALVHAQAMPSLERAALARRLYGYHRLALSPAWRRRLPDNAAVSRLLGLSAPAPNRRLLDTFGQCSADGWWLRWRSHAHPGGGDRRHKLYISPHPAALPDAFARTVRLLVESYAPRLKVARTPPGILRPDKLVAYFADAAAMHAAAARLAPALADLPAQGVPFTEALDDRGMLSHGIDPPSESARGRRPVSWRGWVADRLAGALLVASHSDSSAGEPWRFALHRLELAGVDVVTWSPRDPEWWTPAYR
jgi:hypothetical protein